MSVRIGMNVLLSISWRLSVLAESIHSSLFPWLGRCWVCGRSHWRRCSYRGLLRACFWPFGHVSVQLILRLTFQLSGCGLCGGFLAGSVLGMSTASSAAAFTSRPFSQFLFAFWARLRSMGTSSPTTHLLLLLLFAFYIRLRSVILWMTHRLTG